MELVAAIRDFLFLPTISLFELVILVILVIVIEVLNRHPKLFRGPVPVWARYVLYAVVVAVLAFFAWALNLAHTSERYFDEVNGVPSAQPGPDTYLR